MALQLLKSAKIDLIKKDLEEEVPELPKREYSEEVIEDEFGWSKLADTAIGSCLSCAYYETHFHTRGSDVCSTCVEHGLGRYYVRRK